MIIRYSKTSPSDYPYIFSGVFLFVSSIFLIVALIFGYNTIKTRMSTDAYTMATRVEINSYLSSDSNGSKTMMYSPVFHYNVNDKEYSCSTNFSSSIKPNISNNKIYYKSQYPDFCMNEYDFVQNCIFAGLFFVISLPLFIVGLCVLRCIIIGKNKYKKLRQYGQLIKNIPCKILPSNITYNHKRGYVIQIEYENLVLKSDTKFDIDIRRNTADLLIDPLNPKNYFIDFDITQP